MSNISIFPYRQKKLHNREHLERIVIIKTSWGEISYTGQRLSVYDEDMLMVILALLDDKFNRQLSKVNRIKTYTYRGFILSILRLMGLKGQGAEYSKIRNSLRSLTSTALELEFFRRDINEKQTIVKNQIVNMLTFVQWDENHQELIVTINPFFTKFILMEILLN